ncbi:MAG: hypothetical protein R3E53_15955 [Myxococcota bacterium]
MYTALKEISHLLAIEHLDSPVEAAPKLAARVVAMIVTMNLIFLRLDPLGARDHEGLCRARDGDRDLGLMMLLLADRVSAFIERNRKYEVLGLFILLIVGVVLLGEGGHVAHLTLAGFRVEAMSKTTFYFAISVLVVVDLLQSRYQAKLARQRRIQAATAIA